MTAIKSWFKENQALVGFLIAQFLALTAAGAAFIAYSAKLETRVHIMETRGAEYTVDRMNKIEQRLTQIESQMASNRAQIDRIINEILRAPKP